MADLQNPLRKHFRQPAIYVRLPSGGKQYPPGTINLPPNGELPILPMTAVDEISSRTPDALFNGSAVVEIIRSCVPNITDPWAVPSTDINALLVATRIASYGHDMTISTKCPKCGSEHDFEIDLRMVLDSIKTPDYEQPLAIGDLTIYFTPVTYKQLNENSKIQFEDQKLMQILPNSEIPEEEKMRQLGEAFKRITAMTIRNISSAVGAIKTADAMVTDSNHILEFLNNCPKSTFEAIKDRAIELRRASDIKPIGMKCQDCNNEFQQDFTLDMSNFFETAS